MVPSENPQYDGIIQLLRHFGWTWIALLISGNESGVRFHQTLRPRLFENNICIALTYWIPQEISFLSEESVNEITKDFPFILWHNKKINVILAYGDGPSFECFRAILEQFEFRLNLPLERVWIITSQWDFTAICPPESFTAKTFNGTFSFALHTKVVPEFQDFLESINPYQSQVDFIEYFWTSVFHCSLHTFKLGENNCTGEEKMERLPDPIFEMEMSGWSYSIYNAVYVIAHALHAMHSSSLKLKTMRTEVKQNLLNTEPWKVKHGSS